MTEHAMTREEKIERMTSWPTGLDRDEAQKRLQDDDLWVLEPEARYEFEGQDAVRQWQQAHDFVDGLHGMATNNEMLNDATRQLLGDATVRAHIALERARERATATE